ncbi:hypothetical protein AB0M02_39870 [Actinoplanes sp. NPDC051861]|uniref:hypothetical protein n=1 Tax=Actinoplanes sp. NPDC051861 TaxID=3155170 RepID=UPI00343816AD
MDIHILILVGVDGGGRGGTKNLIQAWSNRASEGVGTGPGGGSASQGAGGGGTGGGR